MSSTFIGWFLLGCLVFIMMAAIIGVLRRKAGLRDAQSLAPADFVFRFSTFGSFTDLLPRLPPDMQVEPLNGVSRVGAASANSDGITLWQVQARRRLAEANWSAIAGIRSGSITFPVAFSSRTYWALFLDVTGEAGRVSLPLLSANAHYFWRRTSAAEVERIADKLEELRTQALTP